MIHRRGPAVTAALLALCAALPLGAQPTPASPPKGSPEQRKTISDLRNVGTAMFLWYQDQMKSRPRREGHREPSAPASAFDKVPEISREDLAKLLVPKYIAEIPEKDGWGHPYEFHLNTKDLDAASVMGLRSSGRDGRFAGAAYEIGAFSPEDEDQDIAWLDGYFVRWPQAKPDHP